jgi:hypothetical protein
MGVNLGKWQQILGEDRKMGEGVMLKKQKVSLQRIIFILDINHNLILFLI